MHRALTVPQTNYHMELFHNICSIRPTEAVFRWSNHFSETKNKSLYTEPSWLSSGFTHFILRAFTLGCAAKPDGRSLSLFCAVHYLPQTAQVNSPSI